MSERNNYCNDLNSTAEARKTQKNMGQYPAVRKRNGIARTFVIAAAAVALGLSGCSGKNSAKKAAVETSPSVMTTSSPETAEHFWDNAKVITAKDGKKQSVATADKVPSTADLSDWENNYVKKNKFSSAVIITDAKKNTGVYTDGNKVYTGVTLKQSSAAEPYTADTSKAEKTYTVSGNMLKEEKASATAATAEEKKKDNNTDSAKTDNKSGNTTSKSSPSSNTKNSNTKSSSSSSGTAVKKSSNATSSNSSANKNSSTASNSNANSSSTKKSSGSGSSSSTKKQSCTVENIPAKTHVVHHDATGHYETVVDQEAYDSDELTGTVLIDGNGHQFMTQEAWSQHADEMLVEADDENAQPGDSIWGCQQYHTEPVYQTVHHDAVTHQQWVQDSAAYDETVVDQPASTKTVCN